MRIATSAGIALGVLALTLAVRPMEAQQQAAVSVSRSVLERYVGEYVYQAGTLALIRLKGDTLIREMSGQQDVYTPISETRFKVGNTPFVAEFVIDSAGGVTQVLKAGNGPELRIARMAAGPVPKSVLERYVGEYPFMPRITFTVRVRGEALTGQQASGGPEVALIPISETRFKVGNGPMEVEFVVDKSGGVTKVVRQGTYEMRALRKPKA